MRRNIISFILICDVRPLLPSNSVRYYLRSFGPVTLYEYHKIILSYPESDRLISLH